MFNNNQNIQKTANIRYVTIDYYTLRVLPESNNNIKCTQICTQYRIRWKTYSISKKSNVMVSKFIFLSNNYLKIN